MRASRLVVLAVLALLAGAASAGRELQQASLKVSKLDLPSISEFLPPATSAAMKMPLNEFLTKVGLPQWEELGLPPISEFMKPVGPVRTSFKLPDKAEFARAANETFLNVMNELLPPELKALTGVGLPKLNLTGILPHFKLPPLPTNLPPLMDLIRALPPVDPNTKIGVPGLPAIKLPPPADVMKFIEGAAAFIQALPKPSNMPSLEEVLAIVNTIGGSVNNVVAAPAASG